MLIFSMDFVKFLLSYYQGHREAVEYLLAERLFHELGHHNNVQFVHGAIREELKLIKRDIQLYQREQQYNNG